MRRTAHNKTDTEDELDKRRSAHRAVEQALEEERKKTWAGKSIELTIITTQPLEDFDLDDLIDPMRAMGDAYVMKARIIEFPKATKRRR